MEIMQDPIHSISDPILPWLRSIIKALAEFKQNQDDNAILMRYTKILWSCIEAFIDNLQYRDDARFIQILALYGDAIQDFRKVLSIMEEKGIGIGCSLLYERAAVFFISKGEFLEAKKVYQLGISRNAEPIANLKSMYTLFIAHFSKLVANVALNQKCHNYLDPWSPSTISDLLKGLDPPIVKYSGYFGSSKNYPGKLGLSFLQKNSRNKVIELGKRNYLIKGCSGQGGFASVFKAYVDSNPDEVVALKIQKPAFPWEFYMYRQLDKRIPDLDRSSFGTAIRVHIFPDWSILVCNYLAHGTLQDAINSYAVMGKCMEEILCMYYTIEMLRMLETLHSVGIIHGDFKPDNLLIRYSRDELTEHEFANRTGPWLEQGLCLVDWGKGIDVNLFPVGTEFQGDCRTSGFRCVQMQEKQSWTFQVDTYGLCVIVHMMLHGRYMSIGKKTTPDGKSFYHPNLSVKRYWNTNLWGSLFSTLLNMKSKDNDTHVLHSLRKSFEEYICQSPRLIRDLKNLLVKQKSSLCSS